MDDLARLGKSGVPSRTLTLDGPVLTFFAVTFAVGIGLVAWLMNLRSGMYDREAVSIFPSLFIFGDYWPALAALLLVPLALVEAVQRFSVRLMLTVSRRPGLFLLFAFLFLGVAARLVYMGHPLSMDEYAPYFQSKVFAAGALTGRFPVELIDWLVPPDFQNMFLVVSRETGDVASSYWPGFALLLTPLQALGVPWLLNPLLGVLSLIVVYQLANEISADHRLASLATLMTAASAAFSVNSISFYSMTAHALLNAIFALLLFTPTVRRCLIAGVVGSVALALHNPFPHALFAAPWFGWLLWREDRRQLVPALLLGYLPGIVVLGIGWHLFLGSMKAPADTRDVSLGLIEYVRGLYGSAFRLPDGSLLKTRAIGLAKLWIWAVPGLLLLAIWGGWRGRSDARVAMLVCSCATTLAGFLFVAFSQGHGWGYRYFHSAWLCLPVLAVAGLSANPDAKTASIYRYAAGLAMLVMIPLTTLHMFQVHDFISRHLRQMPSLDQGTPRVVIINTASGYYAADLVQNDPFLREPVLRVISHGTKNNAAMMQKNFDQLSRLKLTYRGEVWGQPLALKPKTVRDAHVHP